MDDASGFHDKPPRSAVGVAQAAASDQTALTALPRAGWLGKAFAWSLSAAGLRITHVTSAGGQQAAALAARIPGCEPVADPQQVVDGCDLVFIVKIGRAHV